MKTAVTIAGRLTFALLAAASLLSPASAADRSSPDNIFLDGLIGAWNMEGQVLGKPVRYRAQGQRTLADGWLEFHMIDVNTPPGYEARVFLGVDPQAHDIIAHWLDQFGAPGARVVGTGKRADNLLTVTFPYTQGTFRNQWTWEATKREWTLAIDSQSPDGSWKPFASYRLQRSTR